MQSDGVVSDESVIDMPERLKPLRGSGDPQFESESRQAPAAIAAHPAGTPVGVEVEHPEVRLRARFGDKQTIPPDAEMTVAYRARKRSIVDAKRIPQLSTRTKSFPAPEALVNDMVCVIAVPERVSGAARRPSHKRNALPRCGRALIVEMAGVEPASEERTIKITTYVVSLSSLAPPQPTDRSLEEQPRGSRFRPGFALRLRGNALAILPEVGAPLEPDRRDSSETGHLIT